MTLAAQEVKKRPTLTSEIGAPLCCRSSFISCMALAGAADPGAVLVLRGAAGVPSELCCATARLNAATMCRNGHPLVICELSCPAANWSSIVVW